MRFLLFGASLAATMAMAQVGLAQTRPVPPGPRPFPDRPIPTQPQTPSGPRVNDSQLRPLPSQTELRVENFVARNLGCAADLSSADFNISVRLPVQTDALRGDQAEIQILVNGEPQAVLNLTARDGYVIFSRRITAPGSFGETEVVFLLNGTVRSLPQSLEHACTALRPSATDHQPGLLTLPNLAFGEVLYAALSPSPAPRPARSVIGLLEPRITLAPVDSFLDPIIVRDITTTTGRIQFPANPYCPDEVDAYVSATFAIAVRVVRVSNPQDYVGVQAGPFEPWVGFVDTIDGPRWATGVAVGADERYRGTPLPQGYQWIVVRTGLACTRDGLMEVRLDPSGALTESNEGDNVLRLRYATVPQ